MSLFSVERTDKEWSKYFQPYLDPVMVWSPQQQQVIDMVREGKSVFLTGPGGTGKSEVLKYIIQQSDPNSTYVTAMTGIAAVPLGRGAQTLHSFAGIGKGEGTAEDLHKAVKKNKQARERWKTCKLLIIDEISMCPAELFEKLDSIGRSMRTYSKAFGGIQLVVSGDFYQLPPVEKKGNARFVFETKQWLECIPYSNQINFEHIYRQSETEFRTLLNEIRIGEVSTQSFKLLQACTKDLPVVDGILPTSLHCLNRDVDQENETRLSSLKGPIVVYNQQISEGADKINVEVFVKQCSAPIKISIKVGAQVVLLVNFPELQLSNGTRGVVERLDMPLQPGGETVPYVRFANGIGMTVARHAWRMTDKHQNVLVTIYQIPLKLAWALTPHKAQGMTLDLVKVKFDNAWEPGQVYCALSRAKSLKGLQILGKIDKQCIYANPKVKAYYAQLKERQEVAQAAQAEADRVEKEAMQE